LNQSLFVDMAGRLLACGTGAAAGHGDEDRVFSYPMPVAALAGVRVRSVAAGYDHSIALGDGRVYSWGQNYNGQLGLGDQLDRLLPTLVEGLQGVRDISAAGGHSLAVTQSGGVLNWGESFHPGAEDEDFELRPIVVEGFEGVQVRRVCAGWGRAFTIGQAGQLFAWGFGGHGILGHGDERNQPSPKRIEDGAFG
jgi:alpha-tubulin suppressor-like RCC1 family protein